MKNKFKAIKNILLGILVVFLINIAFIHLFPNTLMAYDSHDYFLKSYNFVNENGFSFLNYPHYFRGYVYPFYIFFCRNLFGFLGFTDIDSFKVANALGLSIFLGGILPYYLKSVLKVRTSILQVAILSIVLNFFYPGLMQSTLTDMFAVIFYLMGIFIFIDIYKNRQRSTIFIFFASFFASSFFYFAYNARTIYMFSVAIVFISFIVYMMKNTRYLQMSIAICAIVIGITIAALPQIAVNYQTTNKISYSVPVQVIPGMTENLNLFQLRAGIMYQRYQTYVGNDQTINPGNAYYDLTGMDVLDIENVEYFESYGHYISVVLKHPFKMLGVYFRNICNFLDNRFGEIYVLDLKTNKTLHVTTNLLILSIFGTGLYFTLKNKKMNSLFIVNMISFIMPSLFLIPGAPEIRFFIPVFLYIYTFVIYNLDYKIYFNDLMKEKYKCFIITFIIVVILLFVWNNSYLNMNTL